MVHTFMSKKVAIKNSKNHHIAHKKKRNLVKIMMCVTTDGTIAGVNGPYSATENDAKILKIIIADDEDIFSSLALFDVLILDRGFRDVVNNIKNLDYIKKNEKQFNVMEANESRLVTKTRFIVEARNGHMKSIWKCFSRTKNTYTMPHFMEDFKIGAALINTYFPVIHTDVDVHLNDIGALMLSRKNHKNLLYPIVNSVTINSTSFSAIDLEEMALLPRLSEMDLKIISLGSYQIKNSPGYCQSHLKNNKNQFLLFRCNEPFFRKAWCKISA